MGCCSVPTTSLNITWLLKRAAVMLTAGLVAILLVVIGSRARLGFLANAEAFHILLLIVADVSVSSVLLILIIVVVVVRKLMLINHKTSGPIVGHIIALSLLAVTAGHLLLMDLFMWRTGNARKSPGFNPGWVTWDILTFLIGIPATYPAIFQAMLAPFDFDVDDVWDMTMAQSKLRFVFGLLYVSNILTKSEIIYPYAFTGLVDEALLSPNALQYSMFLTVVFSCLFYWLGKGLRPKASDVLYADYTEKLTQITVRTMVLDVVDSIELFGYFQQAGRLASEHNHTIQFVFGIGLLSAVLTLYLWEFFIADSWLHEMVLTPSLASGDSMRDVSSMNNASFVASATVDDFPASSNPVWTNEGENTVTFASDLVSASESGPAPIVLQDVEMGITEETRHNPIVRLLLWRGLTLVISLVFVDINFLLLRCILWYNYQDFNIFVIKNAVDVLANVAALTDLATSVYRVDGS